jgi:DNA polymerase-3 subunit beta
VKFTTSREALLRPVQLVTGVVERRQTLPVLSNLLLRVGEAGLELTGTDLEVALVARIQTDVAVDQEGSATVPARKLADIWRSLPDGAAVTVQGQADRSVIRSGRSRFALATLPVTDFPKVDGGDHVASLRLKRADVQRLLEQTAFSMAQQDVRYFLNGMLLEVTGDHVRTVATDGHRLAMCTLAAATGLTDRTQVILPRKGVLELGRLLAEGDGEVALEIGRNHLRVGLEPYTLTTKLVDGRFPDYEKVIPRQGGNTLVADRESLRHAFQRASILSNEKYRGVRLTFEREQLTIQANNPEQDEAEEVVAVDYTGNRLEIGFNVNYLLDVLNSLKTESVRIAIADANSSALIEAPGADDSVYVVMPMRL